MKYKWFFVKNNKGEYKKIKCFILEEKQIEKSKYRILNRRNTSRLALVTKFLEAGI